jgi:hypothetical protein
VGVTGLFMKNGMHNALALLGHEVATKDEESWVYEVDINKHLHQFEMYLKFPADLQLPNTEFTSGIFLKKKLQPRMRNHGSMKLTSTNTCTNLKCTSSFQLTFSSPNTEFTSGIF